jgi:hypothetical protein
MVLERLTLLVPSWWLGPEMVLESLGLTEPDLKLVSAARWVMPTVMETVLARQTMSELVRQKLMVSNDLVQENFHLPMLELFSQKEMRQ